MSILITMAKLMATMLLGFYLGRKGIFSPEMNKGLSSAVVQITSPALILYSVTTVEHGNSQTVLTLLYFGVICYLILPFLGLLMAKLLHVEKDLTGMYVLMILFSNNAFMGFPVVQSLFGDEAIFHTSILHIPFNLLFFSLGLYLISKDAGAETHFEKKNLINNGVIASVLALVVYFGGISLPAVLTETLGFVGNITMPLSMLIIGSSMAGYHLKEVFGQPKIYVMSVVRLFLLPLLVFFFVRLFTTNTLIIQVATVTFGMPVAALVAMGSAPYPKQGKTGAIAVAFTTILSMITIPIMALILGI